jgi:hypothetical protein
VTTNNSKKYSVVMLLIAIPILIYFYFLRWRPNIIYGDDLNIYMSHFSLHSFGERMNLDVMYGKFRPIHSLVINFLIEFFKKDLQYVYVFNVVIQSLIVYMLAASLNLFLKLPWLSLFWALIAGLSRFSFFNLSQLYNGGALEGLAMVFFLASLYFVLKVLQKKELPPTRQLQSIIGAIFFANASMYTHERYIVIFPFIILAVLMSGGLKSLTKQQKTGLIIAAFGSILAHILTKKYFYSMSFLMGTAGTHITFSFHSATSFIIDALLSIFQINSGPDYLVGVPFTSLPFFDRALVIILCCAIFATIAFQGFRGYRAYISRKAGSYAHLGILVFLAVLFMAFLIPAVITVRLEQRWLQASFSILILMLAIVLSDVPFRNVFKQNLIFVAFGLLFLWTGYRYLAIGADNLYMANCERIAANFKQAIFNDVIHPGTTQLYMWEKRRDINIENEVDWVLGKGTFFDFYQDRAKVLLFADSTSAIEHINPDSSQIFYAGSTIIDVTGEFLKDSMKNFTDSKIDELTSADKMQYDQNHLLITNNDYDKFLMKGFYENENGLRWTNGNASIGFRGRFKVSDTLAVVLSMYMTPVCKGISPVISIADEKGRIFHSISTERKEGKLTFKFYFQQVTILKRINIVADTIRSYPDPRVLSFPFISLEIDNGHSLD